MGSKYSRFRSSHRGCSDNGDGTLSFPFIWKTQYNPDSVVSEIFLYSVSRTYNSLQIAFFNITDFPNISHYQVRYKNLDNPSNGSWYYKDENTVWPNIGQLGFTLNSLDSDSKYAIQLRAYSVVDDAYSNWSDDFVWETKPNIPFLSAPTGFKSMNIFGTTKAYIAALEDLTDVRVNGVSFGPLSVNQVLETSISPNQLIESEGQHYAISVSGTDVFPNIPASFAEKEFASIRIRNNPQSIGVYALQDSNVRVEDGFGNVLAGPSSVAEGSSITLSFNHYGVTKLSSDGFIVPLVQSDGIIDQHLMMPLSYELISASSYNLNLSTFEENTVVTLKYSDGFQTTQTLQVGVANNFTRGTRQGNSPSVHIISNNPILAMNYADGDGTKMTSALPYALVSNKYVIPHRVQYFTTGSKFDSNITIKDNNGNLLHTIATSSSGNEGDPFKGIVDNPNLFNSYDGFVVESLDGKPFTLIYETDGPEDEIVAIGYQG